MGRHSAVGLIGLGLMGSALADRLLGAGQRAIGWDIDAERRTAHRERGGDVARDAQEVFSSCSRVLLSLPSHREVGDVMQAAGAALCRGLTIIDTTTGDPASSEELAQTLSGQGIVYLDATISGSSAQVRAGSATLMVGGDAESFAACADIFALIGPQTFHTGPAGTGAKMKLVTNLVLGLNRAALAEGLAFAESAGLDLKLSLAVMRGSAAYSRIMDTKGERMIRGDFAPDARLSQHLKDVRLIVDIGRHAGLPMPLSAAHRASARGGRGRGLRRARQQRNHQGPPGGEPQPRPQMSVSPATRSPAASGAPVIADRLSHGSLRRRTRILVLCAGFGGLLFDGFELGLMPLASLSVSKDLLGAGYTPTLGGDWFARFTAALMLGAACGGILLGSLGDRIGRARAMGISIVFYSAFAGLGAWVHTQDQMLVLRFLVGLGVGGVWPNAVALVAECWPDKARPAVAGVMGAAINAGILMLSQIAQIWSVTEDAWRWLFTLAGAPAALGVFVLAFLPESPAWLDSREQRNGHETRDAGRVSCSARRWCRSPSSASRSARSR